MPTDTDDARFSTAETELMTLRMDAEHWRLEAERLALLLADSHAKNGEGNTDAD